MFLKYVHDHSSSYTLTAKDLNRIKPKDAPEVTLEAPLVFPVDEPVEVDEAIAQLILEHKGLYDLIQVDEDGEPVESTVAETDEADAPEETAKAGSLGASSSPGATSSASAGASTAGSSTAGSGGASGGGSSTGPSGGN